MNSNLKFKEARIKHTQLLKETRKAYIVQTQDLLAAITNPNRFWRIISRFRKKKFTSCPIPTEKWVTFLQHIYGASSPSYNLYLGCAHPVLDNEISHEEVLNAVKSLRNNKSPGPDGVINELLKHLPDKWLWHLTRLFNNVMTSGEVPDAWTKIETIVLHKKGDKNDPGNYRGIALANTVAKVFTSVLARKISKWCEEENILPESQNGFRPNRGCEDGIFALDARITVTLSRKKGKLYAAFVDLKRAFDSIAHDVLWAKMYQAEISTRIIRVMQDFYKKARMRVKLAPHIKSEYINVTEGVLQGDPLSPLLFLIVLFDIEKFFIENGHHNVKERIKLLLLADDKVLLADDAVDLQHLLDTLSMYCEQNMLVVNTQKTKVMIFQKAGRKARVRPFRYRGDVLEVVKSYKYLGVPFSTSGLYNEATNYFEGKANAALGSLWGILEASKLNVWSKRSALFGSLVSSTLMYCSSVWGLNHMDVLDKVQRKFLRMVLGLAPYTPGYMLRIETGTDHLRIRVIKRALNLLVKILSMDDSRIPKKCLNNLRAMHDVSVDFNKRNWYTNITEILRETNHDQLLTQNPKVIASTIDEVLEAQRKIQIKKDWDKITVSRFSTTYKCLVTPTQPGLAHYLMIKVPVKVTRVIAQLRMAGEDKPFFRIKDDCFFINSNELCTLCNLNHRETVEHLLVVCPVYEHIRIGQNFFVSFPELVWNINKKTMYKVYNYMLKCLRYRCSILV